MPGLSCEVIPILELGGCYGWRIMRGEEIVKLSPTEYRDRDQAEAACKEWMRTHWAALLPAE